MNPAQRDTRREPPFRAALLRFERQLRAHPVWIGAFTAVLVVVIAILQVRYEGDERELLLLSMTYGLPLALCGYAVGPIAGVVAAAAIAVIWLFGVLGHGFSPGEVAVGFSLRLLGNLGVVGVAALAAMAARARERFVEAQQQLVELRADLVSAFSHDLRGPLFAITGYAEMLRDGRYTSQSLTEQEVLRRILSSASHLDRLVAEMLIAGHSEGGIPLDVEEFAATDVVAELCEEFEQSHRPEVTLRWQASAGQAPLRTDRVKLTSIVRNLVNNALKFTRRGSITVRIDYLPEADAHRVEVEDTGPGIPEDDLPHIFERYFRVGRTRWTPGFGLGLFIVDRFAELLGGSVAARSEVGRGTTFTVTIPRAPIDPAKPAS